MKKRSLWLAAGTLALAGLVGLAGCVNAPVEDASPRPPASSASMAEDASEEREPHPLELQYPDTELGDLEKIAAGEVEIVREEPTGVPWLTPVDELPPVQDYGLDLRWLDLSALDLTGEGAALERVWYDTTTVWPEALPAGFDPAAILEEGKNPGLGLRALHDEGVTGSGQKIAVIDQALFAGHEEYGARLMLYERLASQAEQAQMHGSAVASMAAGRSCGAAPGAELYYIAFTPGTFDEAEEFTYDYTILAAAIRRVMEINEALPEGEKICVVSVSLGFSREDTEAGGDEVWQAIEEAKAAGLFVLTTTPRENYDFDLLGLGRPAGADPDDAASYTAGSFYAERYEREHNFGAGDYFAEGLFVPMDSRSFASFTGAGLYEFSSEGGFSWAVPWLAGVFALCREVNPQLSPEDFIRLAFETAAEGSYVVGANTYSIPNIVQPGALVAAVRAL